MRYITYLILITLFTTLIGCGGNSTSNSTQTVGKGGSMARFVVSGDYLYALNKKEIAVFDISVADNPLPYTTANVPFDVETLFSTKENLYIGAESGVYIYTKPTNTRPMQKISEFTHAKSCDPVVVDGDGFAYVTLNSGGACRLNSGENSLQVLDVRDPENPTMSKNSYGDDNIREMINPKGVGVDNNRLFVCDGIGGLKVFNIEKKEDNQTKEMTVDLIFDRNSTLHDIDCYDLIPNNKNLIVSNGDDVRQFDYSKFPMIELGRVK